MRIVVLVAAAAIATTAGTARAAEPAPPTDKRAWLAHINAPVTATSLPGGGQTVYAIGSRARWNGGPVRLLVLEHRVVAGDGYLRVLLPRRPNGTSGWIPQSDATINSTPWRVEISRARRLVTALRSGRPVAHFRAVVGKPSTPTPAGLLAISEKVRQRNSSGFLGSWVLLLTGFSNVLDRYDGGPGQVALHGRGGSSLRDPLGSGSSHGCIRITNTAITWLANHIREGTPVQIS